MATTARSITIIDHHKTAQESLSEPFPDIWDSVPICDITTIFDMTKSGAVLTWEYFFASHTPELLLYIQDRDLWEWKLDDTSDILKGLSLHDDWRDWARFINKPHLLKTLKVAGAAINRYLYIQSDSITNTPPCKWSYAESFIVPVYNIPGCMLSDTLHMALEKYPESPFAVGYFDLPEKRIYSLRSRTNEDFDVSEIAKRNGGGGHARASGFTVPLNNT